MAMPRSRYSKTIRTTFFAVLILFLGVGALSLSSFWKDYLQYHFGKLSEDAGVISHDVADSLSASSVLLDFIRERLGKDFSLSRADPASLHRLLVESRKEIERWSEIPNLGLTILIDPSGRVVDWRGPYEGSHADVADRAFFKAIKADPALPYAINGLVLARTSGKPNYQIAIPVRNSRGAMECILSQQIDARKMEQSIREVVGDYPSRVVVRTSDGAILMQYPLMPLPSETCPPLKRSLIGNGEAMADGGTSSIFRVPAGSNGFAETTYVAVAEDAKHGISTEVMIPGRTIISMFLKKNRAFLMVMLMGVVLIFGLFYGLCLGGRKLECAIRETTTDHHTGINNRRGFENELERLIKHVRRESKPLTLLFMDIDHFKSFNDRCGHDVGDEVIKGVADCIRKALRRPLDYCCRWGGEEFAMILPDTPVGEGQEIANQLMGCVGELPISALRNTGHPNVTLSVGIASLTAGGIQNWAELIKEADRALLRAKSEGRNRVVIARR
jgi:diguanylate cyclase (GGDEF)-like protein